MDPKIKHDELNEDELDQVTGGVDEAPSAEDAAPGEDGRE